VYYPTGRIDRSLLCRRILIETGISEPQLLPNCGERDQNSEGKSSSNEKAGKYGDVRELNTQNLATLVGPSLLPSNRKGRAAPAKGPLLIGTGDVIRSVRSCPTRARISTLPFAFKAGWDPDSRSGSARCWRWFYQRPPPGGEESPQPQTVASPGANYFRRIIFLSPSFSKLVTGRHDHFDRVLAGGSMAAID